MRKWLAIAFVALGATVLFCSGDDSRRSIHVGSFNIENFPQSARQADGAFAAIAELDLEVVALQEIIDSNALVTVARSRLGESWKGAFCDRCPEQKVGVIYDSARMTLDWSREHQSVVNYRGARPAFEARFEVKGQKPLRVIAVHLKAGGDGGAIREGQLRALRPILTDAIKSGDRVALLGDFNSTSDGDRANISELATASGGVWASRSIECTCYWQRRESCFGAALDHVITSESPKSITVGGGCATDGCDPGQKCPTYRGEVSDHCPLRIDM